MNDQPGFDGGDCCECTCVSGTVFDCGFGGYACLDPSAPCVDDDDVTTLLDDSNQETTLGCIPGYVSDGDCDESNNNEVCGELRWVTNSVCMVDDIRFTSREKMWQTMVSWVSSEYGVSV